MDDRYKYLRNLKKLKEKKFHENFSKIIKTLNYQNIITYEFLKCDNVLDEIKIFYDL